jgi:CRP-like cAMP-binding protein
MTERKTTPKWLMALAGLTHEQSEEIHRRMRACSYPARAILFHEGEPSDTLVVMRNGRVRLFLTTAEGEEFTLSILTGGSILGLAAAVLQRPRILTAQAVGAVDVSILPVPDMTHCMRTIPQFAINLTRLLAILSVENIERSAPLALDSATARLGRILVALASPGCEGPTVEGLTHDDLAKMVGATRTWVSLTLADFERKGLLRKQPGKIVLLNARGLSVQRP